LREPQAPSTTQCRFSSGWVQRRPLSWYRNSVNREQLADNEASSWP